MLDYMQDSKAARSAVAKPVAEWPDPAAAAAAAVVGAAPCAGGCDALHLWQQAEPALQLLAPSLSAELCAVWTVEQLVPYARPAWHPPAELYCLRCLCRAFQAKPLIHC